MTKSEKRSLHFLILANLVFYCQSYENVTHLTFDPTTQICCNDNILDKPSTENMCCNVQAYNPDTEYCCNGVIHRIKEGYECCDKMLYNTETERCVYDMADKTNRIVQPDGEKYLSCRGKLFDYNTEFCCKGEVVDNADNGLACCDNKVIDLKENICCYNKNNEEIELKRKTPEDVCYFDVVINPEKELYCKDVVLPNPDGNLECCGTETFDKSKGFLCCEQVNSTNIVSKTHPDHDDCCGDITYSTTQGICCQFGNTVKYHPFINGKSAPYCCGAEVYYGDEETSCCHDKIFNYKQQTCCVDYSQSEYVANVYGGGDLSCCGGVTFDAEKQICCGETLLEKSGSGSCCNYDYDFTGNK